ncbi:hypothetical protein L5515_006946 [Caenorhabditis briggsae]|uniref:L-Fucosyltransferase n=1 Tax=Caenorhabditis briggsae TaxID=6238 RepID=A0AAE9F2T5_CAEBR|nr:hypothetical protein L5515_006946 [Caenorhabditis briggsae]
MFNNVTLPVIPLINKTEPPKANKNVLEPPKKYLSTNLAANARLGNHLFEMASLYGISKKLERIPTFFIDTQWHDTMLQETDFLIPGLIDHFLIVNDTFPKHLPHTIFHPQCCIFEDPNRLKNITDEYMHLTGAFYQSWKYFSRLRNELMGYLKEPSNNFTSLPKSDESTFITCVHIRRTDFVGSGFHVPEKDFIINAMKFVEEKEKKLISMNYTTVFFTDDADYVKTLLKEKFELKDGTVKNLETDSVISDTDPPDSILYSSRHCDTVLFTAPHSTFGWWLGYLSKGNQVYYTDLKFVNDLSFPAEKFNPDDYYPPHWTPVKYGGPGNAAVIESLNLGNNSLALVMSMNLGKLNGIAGHSANTINHTKIVVMARNQTTGTVVSTRYERITPHDNCQIVTVFATVQLLPDPVHIALISNEDSTEVSRNQSRKICVKGYITLQPWDRVLFPFVPGDIADPYQEIEFQSLAGAQTDCLLQYKETAEFVALFDLNDILIPRSASTLLEEFRHILGSQERVSFLSYTWKNYEINVFNNTKFSISSMVDSLADRNTTKFSKTVVVTKNLNFTWIDRPYFAPDGFISLDVVDNSIIHLEEIIWIDQNNTKDLKSYTKESSNFSFPYDALSDIETDFDQMLNKERIAEIIPNLPNFFHFYYLTNKCLQDSKSISLKRCPGPQMCGFYQHPNLHKQPERLLTNLSSYYVTTHQGNVSLEELNENVRDERSKNQVHELLFQVYKPFGYQITEPTLPVPTLVLIIEHTCLMVFEDWYTISQVPQPETPPSQMPEDQTDRFSLNGYAALQTMYFNDHNKTADLIGNWDNITSLMKLSKTDLLALASHREAESIYNAMDNFPLDGMRGIVVGSTSQPWLEVMALQHGARNVVTIQRNKFNIQEEFRNRISAIFPAYLANNWQKFLGRLDFVASFSSIQHLGLGRYGDSIDPIGDLREMQKIKCMLKKGGILFLGVPFGTDAIHFNAQRYYGPIRLAMLFQGFEWVATYSADSEKKFDLDTLRLHSEGLFKSSHYTVVLRKL